MNAIYSMFRRLGLSAHQAYAAAYCAVRCRIFDSSEAAHWVHLFASRSAEQSANIRLAVSHIQPVR